ncbi:MULTISPECIES: RNA polymerase sigma factor [unclassified Clostridium]|uniref:RNA polymerase sigma factor n=1 Tax=unclassified Clostridium TaxID=2614128 RepID=UPI0002972FE8|nr:MULTISPECIES: RNA polymerase sigma factor [unclassified Clostridium]EKQ58293.1 MAG: RNA polymerase sigma factor, sigma-70 family [Clostridium sp. Maddingley MBC34-26]
MSESEIVRKIQSGDIDALGEIFELYKNTALKYSYLITNDKFASEDIVQEAFIKCYLNAKSLKNVEQFKAWFFKILTRIAWKRIDKDKKALPIENIFEKANNDSIDKCVNIYLKNQEDQILHSEIEKLDLMQKTVIVLFYFNGLTVKEIAKVMGCFEGTVKSRLYSARKKLKESLENSNEKNFVYVKECKF